MHAQITAYKGRLIFNLLTKKSIKHEIITKLDSDISPGHIIINTKKNLGISEEALQLLKTIHKGQDDIGHLDWSKSFNGLDSFIWTGLSSDIKKPCDLEASKKYKIMSHVVIKNDVPQGAIQAIDNLENKYKK